MKIIINKTKDLDTSQKFQKRQIEGTIRESGRAREGDNTEEEKRRGRASRAVRNGT